MKNIIKKKGISAILTVVVISAASLIMARSAAILSYGSLDMGYRGSQGSKALYIADACIEETLRRIRLNTSYSATDYSLQINGYSCIINVTINGNDRSITSEGRMRNYRKNISVDLTLSDNVITITNWEEDAG